MVDCQSGKNVFDVYTNHSKSISLFVLFLSLETMQNEKLHNFPFNASVCFSRDAPNTAVYQTNDHFDHE